MTHLEATAIQTMMACDPVYLSPYCPPIGANLDADFEGGLQALMVSGMNAKHLDSNSRLTTKRGKNLRGYADRNSCLIFGPNTLTTNPYNPSATPDVLDIVLTRNIASSVHLASGSSLSSKDLSVLIDRACRSSFQHSPDRSDFRRSDWVKFHTNLHAEIPLNPELQTRMAIDTCV
jgi:hypothetical protein